MDKRKFNTTLENISNNLSLIDEILKTSDESLLSNPKRIERAKYFFISAVQSLLNLSNEYIEAKNWRNPINAMDVFIVLSENNLISRERVPTLKRAISSISFFGQHSNKDALDIMRECLKSIEHCVSAYKVLLQTGEL